MAPNLPLVKLARVLRAGYILVKDPNRLDEVIGLADELGNDQAFDAILVHVRATDDGRAALRDRPRVRVNLPRLRALPDGTFGREAARFLDERGLDPDSLPHRPGGTDSQWLRAHLLETHDLWHVATGFDTDVPGEAGLQAFYLAQFPGRLPAVLLSILFANMFLYKFEETDARMDAIARGWAMGKRARQLLGVRWGDLWEKPLTEVRAQLAIAPQLSA
ncbi:MAG TPA: Coq4 family protein [Kofleriaceae bacterium]|nr:Coq4 family protein [Kofleriaceae bacterium]